MSSTIKHILVTHAAPSEENNPYAQLAQQFGLKVDFQSFVQIEGLPTSEFRKQNVSLLDYTAIVFTGKPAIDHYFRIARDLRVEMPPETKYFCVSEATAKYLQKYIVIRKRKLFVAEKTVSQLIPLVKKHPKETYLFPRGEKTKSELVEYMEANRHTLKEAMVYQSINLDMKQTDFSKYDLICFFSPASIEIVAQDQPEILKSSKLFAVFGTPTLKAAEAAGLRVDIQAPTEESPSLIMAIEKYINSRSTPRKKSVDKQLAGTKAT